MTTNERKELLSSRTGSLEHYNLWEFWDSLSDDNQNGILNYFESTPLMFDYKTIFKGDIGSDNDHGAISEIDTLLVVNDLELADSCFTQFEKYNEGNYNKNSKWGNNWEKNQKYYIEIWKDIVKNSEPDKLIDNKIELEKNQTLTIGDVYWSNAHFFIHKYSTIAYKNYLNGNCDINRFKLSFLFSYKNIDRIKEGITKIYGWEKSPKNGIIEQYLIYLEKQKDYKNCIEIILQLKDKGWRNDFEKRLNRCINKLIQSDNKS
ncbi:MAG: hypothetical protein WCP52_12130 [Bacteroidota bacterium]